MPLLRVSHCRPLPGPSSVSEAAQALCCEPTKPQACREVVQETGKPGSAHRLGGACPPPPPPPSEPQGRCCYSTAPRERVGRVAFLGARKETPQVMSAETSLLKGCFQFPLLSGPGVSQASVNSRRETEPHLHLQGTWAATGAASGLKEELDLHSVH